MDRNEKRRNLKENTKFDEDYFLRLLSMSKDELQKIADTKLAEQNQHKEEIKAKLKIHQETAQAAIDLMKNMSQALTEEKIIDKKFTELQECLSISQTNYNNTIDPIEILSNAVQKCKDEYSEIAEIYTQKLQTIEDLGEKLENWIADIDKETVELNENVIRERNNLEQAARVLSEKLQLLEQKNIEKTESDEAVNAVNINKLNENLTSAKISLEQLMKDNNELRNIREGGEIQLQEKSTELYEAKERLRTIEKETEVCLLDSRCLEQQIIDEMSVCLQMVQAQIDNDCAVVDAANVNIAVELREKMAEKAMEEAGLNGVTQQIQHVQNQLQEFNEMKQDMDEQIVYLSNKITNILSSSNAQLLTKRDTIKTDLEREKMKVAKLETDHENFRIDYQKKFRAEQQKQMLMGLADNASNMSESDVKMDNVRSQHSMSSSIDDIISKVDISRLLENTNNISDDS